MLRDELTNLKLDGTIFWSSMYKKKKKEGGGEKKNQFETFVSCSSVGRKRRCIWRPV